MTTLWPVVLAHVSGGVTIIPYGFDTLDQANAFRYKYNDDGMLFDAEGTLIEAGPPEMPSGFTDDHESDTWVLIEGAGIQYVDGDEPIDGREFITTEEVALAAQRD
jgi:hypothetical protein